jgi:hypothetical protein
VIGVIGTPIENNIDWTEKQILDASLSGRSIIIASYVKYLEASGARVIPIHYKMSKLEIAQMFGSVNGILFTGGTAPFFESELDGTA